MVRHGRFRGGVLTRRTYFRERVYRQPGPAEVANPGYGGVDSVERFDYFQCGSTVEYNEQFLAKAVAGFLANNGIDITRFIASIGRASTAFEWVGLYDVGPNAGLKQMRFLVDMISFYDGVGPVARQTVVGAKGGNVALANLCTALHNLGLIVDNTT